MPTYPEGFSRRISSCLRTPISQSATVNNAAKDDVLGNDGVYHYTYTEMLAKLLANDPGGANKLADHFFFGSTAPANGGVPSVATQAAYLEGLGIHSHLNADGSFASFDVGVGAQDFDYFVQMGNKGTWSEAHVDVTAPVPVAHLGPELFSENFDHGSNYTSIYDPANGNEVAGLTDLNTVSGWTGAEHTEIGIYPYGDIHPTSGSHWLDTQNSPGGINISHAFDDNTKAPAVKLLPGQTEPAHAGASAILSFDIGTQSVNFNGQPYATDPNASFEFKIDGNTVATFHASDFANPNQLQHFDIDIGGSAGGYTSGDTHHTLSLVDNSASGYTGFAVDSIQIHDWIV